MNSNPNLLYISTHTRIFVLRYVDSTKIAFIQHEGEGKECFIVYFNMFVHVLQNYS